MDDHFREIHTDTWRVRLDVSGQVVGLEIPNEARQLVTLGEIIRSEEFDKNASPLTLALGKDIGGNSMVADLEKILSK